MILLEAKVAELGRFGVIQSAHYRSGRVEGYSGTRGDCIGWHWRSDPAVVYYG